LEGLFRCLCHLSKIVGEPLTCKRLQTADSECPNRSIRFVRCHPDILRRRETVCRRYFRVLERNGDAAPANSVRDSSAWRADSTYDGLMRESRGTA
jgi:hypothetical protein